MLFLFSEAIKNEIDIGGRILNIDVISEQIGDLILTRSAFQDHTLSINTGAFN